MGAHAEYIMYPVCRKEIKSIKDIFPGVVYQTAALRETARDIAGILETWILLTGEAPSFGAVPSKACVDVAL